MDEFSGDIKNTLFLFDFKVKTKSEMASLWGMSRSTFYRQLKLSAGLLSPLEQKKILKAFGVVEKTPFLKEKMKVIQNDTVCYG